MRLNALPLEEESHLVKVLGFMMESRLVDLRKVTQTKKGLMNGGKIEERM